MIKRQIHAYFESYRGLSQEIWLLSLITFINRAGTMVVPFLSIYLTASLGFTLANVGWIMTCFGLGSIVGTWLGGKLSDEIGYYKVMLFSLISGGVAFIVLQYLASYTAMCIGIFVLTLFADMFRPAMYVSIRAYSKPENITRSVTLIRLAINLGFSMGPAIGGLIIATSTYGTLFWVDGITCIVAAILLYLLISEKEGLVSKSNIDEKLESKSAYTDLSYLVFLGVVFFTGFVFLQLFASAPLYYKTQHMLTESQIGWLISLNGLVIFLFEMPLINYLENKKIPKGKIIWMGTLILGLGFWVFNISEWTGILVISMLFITVGEMLVFPFANSFALDRSKRGKPGEYMALFPIAFSLAHIVSPNAGMQLVENFGFTFTWNMMFVATILGLILCYYLMHRLKLEKA